MESSRHSTRAATGNRTRIPRVALSSSALELWPQTAFAVEQQDGFEPSFRGCPRVLPTGRPLWCTPSGIRPKPTRIEKREPSAGLAPAIFSLPVRSPAIWASTAKRRQGFVATSIPAPLHWATGRTPAGLAPALFRIMGCSHDCIRRKQNGSKFCEDNECPKAPRTKRV